MRIVLESTLEHVAASDNSTHLSFGPICDGGMTAGLRLDVNVRPTYDIRTSFIGKPCRIVVEFDEPSDLRFADPRPVDFGSGGAIHVNSARQSPVVSVSQGGVHVSDLSGESAAERIIAVAAKNGGSGPSGHCYGNPAMTPLVNPLDDGWRVLIAAMEKRGFVQMPFDGTRVVKFLRSDGPLATSRHEWVDVSDEYAARFSGASEPDVNSLLSAMGIQ